MILIIGMMKSEYFHYMLPEQYELVSYPHSFEWHGPKSCGVIKIDSFYNEANHYSF